MANVNFEDILDESSSSSSSSSEEEEEDRALSEDSNYISDHSDSDDLTIIADKVVDNSQILALSGRTKVCTIYFYYTTGDSSALCTSCMISIQDFDHMYAVRKHVIEIHDAVESRCCSNCKNPVYLHFPCNLCPICTHV